MKETSKTVVCRKEHPERLKHPIVIGGGTYLIYEGEIKLHCEHNDILLHGKVEYKLVRYPKVFISGRIISVSDSPSIHDFAYQILIGGRDCGSIVINDSTISSDPEKSFAYGVSRDFFWPIEDTEPDYLLFAIPNMRELFGGELLMDVKGTNTRRSMDRFLISKTNPFLAIDKVEDFKQRFRQLKTDGQYDILYTGRLDLYQQLSFKEFKYIIPVFLSFINGRKAGTIMNAGMVDGRPVFIDFSQETIEPYQYVSSWSSIHFPVFKDIWGKFNELWKDELDRDFLITVIHWYVESNSNAGKLEGSIILMQTALELIFNWLVVEHLRLIDKKSAKRLSAEQKIACILAQLNVPINIPELYNSLSSHLGYDNGPKAITEIRNALVHGNVNKRRKMLIVSSEVTFQTLHLGLWYVELSILFILDYKGLYNNRTSVNKWTDSGERVPWAIK
ncbi:hypothetical protein H8B06_05950 [Sphingobacterium sp. DN00404]|uniref:YopA central domain-containing protein n=1 Tax=Sphingobacterium micropteri TaxID=2763501 RepID=A0ABR7YLZ3_9SPHI|nr:hypothetical protein [Sphingobacterium micropteri]MBD1432360.1 hypothetical protein [Sphingobacterium micropteri]